MIALETIWSTACFAMSKEKLLFVFVFDPLRPAEDVLGKLRWVWSSFSANADRAEVVDADPAMLLDASVVGGDAGVV